jgi:hypothetical protein
MSFRKLKNSTEFKSFLKEGEVKAAALRLAALIKL